MEKTYFNSLKGKKTKFGVRIFGKTEEVINEIMKHEKRGWINLELKERKEPDNQNCTHYLIVDEFTKDDFKFKKEGRVDEHLHKTGY
jgi:hypothetical protein